MKQPEAAPKKPAADTVSDAEMEQINYMIKCDTISAENSKFRPVLAKLNDFGFTNFDLNIKLAI